MGAVPAGSCSSLGPQTLSSTLFSLGSRKLQLPGMPGGSRWERGCCYQYGGCQPDKDSQSDVIETREVFRGRLGDRGLPSPRCSSCLGLEPSSAPPAGRPAVKNPLPLPPSSSLPQPSSGTLGRGLSLVHGTQLGFRGEWGRLRPDCLKSLSSLLALL